MIGFLLIDKPKGYTSFSCVKTLRRLLNTRKIGFVGTLDPKASGLMIFAINNATKLIPFFENYNKKYDVKIVFGKTSSTFDSEGELIYKVNPVICDRSSIEKVLNESFLGEIDQFPPKFSAVWIDGKRAYDLARSDIDFDVKSRKVSLYSYEILSFDWPVLEIRVFCSKGFYIRSLANDLGEALGCGGYVEDLRRISHGSFNVDDSVFIEDLNVDNVFKYLISPEKMLPQFLKIDFSDNEYKILTNGGFIENRFNLSEKDGYVFGMLDGRCVGVVEFYNGLLKFYKRLDVEPKH